MKEKSVESIDLAIAYFMAEQKINREQMADLMGMAPNTLRWKREGKTDWSLSELLHLSDITGKSPNELAGIE